MRWRTTLTALSLATLIAAPALAQVKLERKILEGKSTTVDTTTRMEQKLTIAGMDIETTSDTQASLKVTTGKRDADGKLKAEEKFDSLQVQIKAAGSEYLFDSKNPDKTGSSPLESIRKLHQVQARSKTTKVFDKENKLVGIEFEEDLLNGLDDTAKTLVQGQLDPEKMKKSANEESERIPATLINKGDSWDHTTKANLGAGQVMTIVTKYTYDGEIEKGGRKLDKIIFKVNSVDLAFEDSPLPIKLKKSDLKPTESKGELLFDRELGKVVESASQITIKGDLVFTAGDNELPSKLDLKMESTTKLK